MSRPRRSALTETDLLEWASFARLIRPLRGRAVPELPAEPVVVAAVVAALGRVEPRRAAVREVPGLAVGQHPGGLDNSSWNRFRSGKLVG